MCLCFFFFFVLLPQFGEIKLIIENKCVDAVHLFLAIFSHSLAQLTVDMQALALCNLTRY